MIQDVFKKFFIKKKSGGMYSRPKYSNYSAYSFLSLIFTDTGLLK